MITSSLLHYVATCSWHSPFFEYVVIAVQHLRTSHDTHVHSCAAQSASAGEANLQDRRERLAAESPDSQEARLQRMRDRLPAETSEEQEARLQQMSNRQRDRLAAETPEQRQAKLHVHQSQLPLFEQPCV